VANSLQNDAAYESALFHVIESKASKNNKKHVHSLFDNVYNFDESACGIYISYYELRNLAANDRKLIIDIPLNIPITDMLTFQSFREFPNAIFGELKIKFTLNNNAWVFCQVNPEKSIPKFLQIHQKELTYTELTAMNEVCKYLPSLWNYDRGFFQFGTYAQLIGYKENQGQWTFENPPEFVTKRNTINLPSFTVAKCSCVIKGFKMDPQALEAERQKFMTEKFVIPAQKILMYPFTQAMTSTGLKSSQNIPLSHVTDFMVIFPKYSQQVTCWENPMLQNLQLNVLSSNYPFKPVSTIGPNWVQMQLQAADLASFNLEATEEYENSLVVPRANEKQRLVPDTDLTSFVAIFPVERNSGAGLYFDGLDTNGQNTSVEIRGNPIYGGSLDTYYNVDTDNNHPPAPILALVQDTYWIFDARPNRIALYEVSREFNDVIQGD